MNQIININNNQYKFSNKFNTSNLVKNITKYDSKITHKVKKAIKIINEDETQ